MGFSLGGVAKSLAGGSALLSAFGAYEDAKAQKKQIKANRDAQLEVLNANTKANLDSLKADTAAAVQVQQADATAKISALLYDAQTEQGNYKLEGLQASDALNRGLLDEFNLRRDASQAQGQQRAQLASSGVDVNSGSAAYLQEDTVVKTDLESLAIQQNAQRENFGFQVQQYDTLRKIGLDAMEAKSTADVANANIAGIKSTSAVKQKGIQDTAKANEKAIRKVAGASYNAISPGLSSLSAGLSSAVSSAPLFLK